MELRAALRKLAAAEHALAEARRTIEEITLAPAPELTPTPPPAPGRETSRPSASAVVYPVAPARPGPSGRSAPHPSTPPRPAKPPVPFETKVIRGIAIAGSLITVAGVGLAVALAIQHGLLGPLGRVLLAAVLAAALLGVGLWLDHRKEAPAGVAALVSTSFLIFSIIVVSLVRLLEWWSYGVGTIGLVATWLVFLVLYRQRGFWVLALVMATAAFPTVESMVIPGEPAAWPLTLLPLLLLAATWGRERVEVRLGAAVVAVLLQLRFGGFGEFAFQEFGVFVGVGLALTFAVVALLDAPTSRFSTAIGAVTPAVLLFIAALSATAGSLPRWAPASLAIWLVLPAAAVLAALGNLHRDDAREHTRGLARLLEPLGICAVAVAFLFVWLAAPPLGTGERLDAAIVVALFFAAAVAVIVWLERHPVAGPLPWFFWLVVALWITWRLSGSVLLKQPLWLTDHIAAVQALLIVAFLAAAVSRRGALAGFAPWIQAVFAVAALHLSMVAIVSATTWAGQLIAGETGMWLGYLIGHAAVSVLWMVLAGWVLLADTGLAQRSSLSTGVLLAVAATVKLVFFDLGTLEGLPRAVAFLVSGVALLTISVLRTRRGPSGPEGRDADDDDERHRRAQYQDGQYPAGGTADVEGEVTS